MSETILLNEKADFNKYSKIWSKELFDRVISIDSTKDRRYETWLLDIFRRETLNDINLAIKSENWESNVLNTLRHKEIPKEFLDKFVSIYISSLFNDSIFLKPAAYGDIIKYILNKAGIKVESLTKEQNFSLLSNILSHALIILKSNNTIYSRYISSNEDRPALTEALQIHEWLSNSNRIPMEQRNISRYKTIQELMNFVQSYRSTYEAAHDSNTEGSETVKVGRDFTVIYKDKNVIIVNIITFLGSEYWACKGTSWCIRGGTYRQYGSENYFNRTYTDRSEGGNSPVVFYIKTLEDGEKYKMAFVEGPEVQYRTPTNEELTLDEVRKIPDNHQKIMSDYLWLFRLLTGRSRFILNYDEYAVAIDNVPMPDYVYEVIDFNDLKRKKWENLTSVEQKFLEGLDEIVNDIADNTDYDFLDDTNIGDYIDEEPVETDEDGEPAWSEEQREQAKQNYNDKQMEYNYDEIYKEYNNARIDNLTHSFRQGKDVYELVKEYYRETFSKVLSVETLNEVENDIGLERIGTALVAKEGYKNPTVQKTKENLIERLLRRFK